MVCRRFSYLFWLFLLAASPALASDEIGLQFGFAPQIERRFGEVTAQGHLNIYVTGQFRDGDASRFANFVERNQLEMANIVFDSPGGSLVEGLTLGRLIRELGFDTSIGNLTDEPGRNSNSVCASACAYAFAGGSIRTMVQGSRLGLHQFRSASNTGASEAEAQTVSAILVSYLTEMGIDAQAFAIASMAQPNEMVWLTYDDAMEINLINTGVLATTAEVRLIDMRPYLRLNQSRPSVDLRALIMCWDRQISVLAGIVTNQSRSGEISDPEWVARSYLELDNTELLAVPGTAGLDVNEDTVWLTRALAPHSVEHLLAADTLGIWIDGFGMLRAGGTIDLTEVRPAISDYIRQCYASR